MIEAAAGRSPGAEVGVAAPVRERMALRETRQDGASSDEVGAAVGGEIVEEAAWALERPDSGAGQANSCEGVEI